MTHVIIVGGGKGGEALLEMLHRSIIVKLLGVADADPETPGMKLAEGLGVPTASDMKRLPGWKKADQIINATGSLAVQDRLLREKPPNAEVIGGRSASFLWAVLQRFRLAQESQRKAKERAELLLDITPSAVFTVDNERRITGWNRQAERVTGYTAAEVLGKPCSLFALAPCSTRCGLLSKDVDKPICGKECALRAKDGRILSISKNADLLRDEDGRVTGGIECFTDITRKKAEERALQESEQKLRAVLDHASTVIYMKDLDGRYITVNRRYEELFHVKAAELAGKTDHAVFPKEVAEKLREQDRLCAASGKPIEAEEHVPHDDGMHIYISIKFPLLDDAGKAYATCGISTDITGRKRAEESLRSANRLNEALLGTIPFPMDIVDEEGTILFADAKLTQMLGGGIIGRRCWEVYRDDRKPCADCPVKQGIRIGETRATESKGVFGGKCFRITHAGMRYKDRKAVLEIFEDVTIRRKAEDEHKRNLDIRSGFISMVSHELRTPLTAVKEGLDIVLEGEAGRLNEDQDRFLQLSKRNVDRLARLINDVLQFQKLEAGKLSFKMKPDDLSSTVGDVLSTMLPAARAKGLELSYKNGVSMPRIRFDRDKIIQVLTNLMNNAIKFTEKGGVELRLSLKESEAEVTVKDTGPGIAPEDIPRLFHTFEQFGKAKEMSGGTGLGLAISKRIVDAHKGRIWAESEPGKGSMFHVTLPFNDWEG